VLQNNKLYVGDCFELSKQLTDNSVTLAVTSPPYADIRSTYPGCPAHNYVKWFRPLAQEILRSLKDDGSFILNINDKCDKGERIPFAFELVIALRELGFKFIDTIIWAKKNGSPNAGRRRADYFEYIFHFAKTVKPVWNPDLVRTPYAETSLKRAEKPIKSNVSNRENRTEDSYKKWNLHPQGAYPKNVIHFPKDGGKDHVAAFHFELPQHFILAHSNPGDLVLDPFAGRGTSLYAAHLNNRSFIGFEIKEEHALLAKNLYNISVA